MENKKESNTKVFDELIDELNLEAQKYLLKGIIDATLDKRLPDYYFSIEERNQGAMAILDVLVKLGTIKKELYDTLFLKYGGIDTNKNK